jgi:hypothetical protein
MNTTTESETNASAPEVPQPKTKRATAKKGKPSGTGGPGPVFPLGCRPTRQARLNAFGSRFVSTAGIERVVKKSGPETSRTHDMAPTKGFSSWARWCLGQPENAIGPIACRDAQCYVFLTSTCLKFFVAKSASELRNLRPSALGHINRSRVSRPASSDQEPSSDLEPSRELVTRATRQAFVWQVYPSSAIGCCYPSKSLVI